jgi:hypothetical protein
MAPELLAPSPIDVLPPALCAAELGQPIDLQPLARAPRALLEPLLRLRTIVPHAVLCLLERLAAATVPELRALAAGALEAFAAIAPARVETLLEQLADDGDRTVRLACAAPLAALLRQSDDRRTLTRAWRHRSWRTRQVLWRARHLVPPLPARARAARRTRR